MGAVQVFAIGLSFVSETCCNCGVAFAMEQNFRSMKVDKGTTFYCPNGHSQHYTETTEAKHKREKEQLEKRIRWAEESRDVARKEASRQERQARAYKGVITKTKKRVGNGVCPCCNRTFSNLMNHMHRQHPEYKETK